MNWWFVAFALGLYPFIVLCVAITGPHSEFERQDNLRQRLASVDGRRMAETGTGSGRSPTSAVAKPDAQIPGEGPQP